MFACGVDPPPNMPPPAVEVEAPNKPVPPVLAAPKADPDVPELVPNDGAVEPKPPVVKQGA